MKLFSISAALSLLLFNPALAGQITALNWFSGVGSVAGDFIFPPSAPNNDDVVGNSPNTLLITQKAYFGIGPVDIELTVVPSGGTTEYRIMEGVDNGTGIPWSAYRIELGFGVGSAFTPSPPGDGLDFDAPFFNSPPDFSGSLFFNDDSESEDVLIAFDGLFPVGGFPSPLYEFSIDVPDGITSFTIRQIPIPVPEPAAAVLGVVGLAGLATGRRVPRRTRRLPG